MSEVNLDELARNAIDAFNTGDTDRLLSMCDPEIEFFSPSEQRTTGDLTVWRDTWMTSLP